MNVGVRPPAKIPYWLQDEIEPFFDKIYYTAVPIDGRELFVASQVIPVVKMKDGKPNIRPVLNTRTL